MRNFLIMLKTDALKTALIRVIQKIAKAACDLTGNKNADKSARLKNFTTE